MRLPDPRRYGSTARAHRLLAIDDPNLLVATLRNLAARRDDREIHEALASAPCQQTYIRLWRALCDAVEKPGTSEEVTARVFAMPWVLVCAGAARGVIDGVLPRVEELTHALEKHGAFGASRTVGFSNVLCGIEALEALEPSTVLSGWTSERIRAIAPASIEVFPGVEQVHVRFLLGAAVTASHAPDIVETGSNISAWGTYALRAMTAQLATSYAQILPLARPPAGLYSAAFAGRRAGLETAFNLFISNAVRRFRSTFGDPSATVSAHESGELRVTLWSVLDDELAEGFQWPLHPADDLVEMEKTILNMMHACRIDEVRVIGAVLPDRTRAGAVFFPAGSNADEGDPE